MSTDQPTSGASGADPSVPGSDWPAPAGDMPQPTPVPPSPGIASPAAAPDPAPHSTAPVPVTGAPYPATGVPYPVTAPPYGPTPPPRRGPWVVVLGIVSGVLLLVSGALGTLYYLQRDEARRTSAEQQAQITALQDEIAQLREELDETRTRLQRAEDDLADAQACSDAVQEFIDAAIEIGMSGGSELPPGEAEMLVFEMMGACDLSL